MPFDLDETSIDRFARLSMVASGLTGDVLPAEILDIVIRQGAAGMGSDHGMAMLIQGEFLHPIAALGAGRSLARRFGTLPLDSPAPIAIAARRGAAVFVSDRQQLEAEFPWLVPHVPSHLEAAAALPLVASGRTYGAIGLLFGSVHTFGPDERGFLQALADMAALALRPWAHPAAGPLVDAGPLPPEIGSVTAGEVEAALAIDADGRIVQANRRLCRLLGYTPQDLIGGAIEVLIPDRYRAEHAVHVRRYLADPTPRPYGSGLDLVARRADGRDMAVDVSLSPVAGPEGVIVVAVVRVPASRPDGAG